MSVSKITYESFDGDPFIDSISTDDATKGAYEILKWAYTTYGEDIVYSCSFGAESMVLINLIYQIKPDAQIVFLDTDLHFQETYDLIDRVKECFPKLRIEMKKPELTLEEQAEKYNPALWKNNPNQCCYIRKIKPLEEVLGGAIAWISDYEEINLRLVLKQISLIKMNVLNRLKVCPLIYWTEDDVWDYIKQHDLPYNELHDQHYPSIGCIPCTAPVFNSDDSRAGRWSSFEKQNVDFMLQINRDVRFKNFIQKHSILIRI